MSIYTVKKELFDHVGDIIKIKYNLGRNKYEEYVAVIKELYDFVFLVDTSLGVKSFSYIDVVTKNVKITY